MPVGVVEDLSNIKFSDSRSFFDRAFGKALDAYHYFSPTKHVIHKGVLVEVVNDTLGAQAYQRVKKDVNTALSVAPLLAAVAPHPVTYGLALAGGVRNLVEAGLHGGKVDKFSAALAFMSMGSNLGVAAQTNAPPSPNYNYAPNCAGRLANVQYWYERSSNDWQPYQDCLIVPIFSRECTGIEVLTSRWKDDPLVCRQMPVAKCDNEVLFQSAPYVTSRTIETPEGPRTEWGSVSNLCYSNPATTQPAGGTVVWGSQLPNYEITISYNYRESFNTDCERMRASCAIACRPPGQGPQGNRFIPSIPTWSCKTAAEMLPTYDTCHNSANSIGRVMYFKTWETALYCAGTPYWSNEAWRCQRGTIGFCTDLLGNWSPITRTHCNSYEHRYCVDGQPPDAWGDGLTHEGVSGQAALFILPTNILVSGEPTPDQNAISRQRMEDVCRAMKSRCLTLSQPPTTQAPTAATTEATTLPPPVTTEATTEAPTTTPTTELTTEPTTATTEPTTMSTTEAPTVSVPTLEPVANVTTVLPTYMSTEPAKNVTLPTGNNYSNISETEDSTLNRDAMNGGISGAVIVGGLLVAGGVVGGLVYKNYQRKKELELPVAYQGKGEQVTVEVV